MAASLSHRPASPPAKRPPAAKAAKAVITLNFVDLFHADAMERVQWIKRGVPATVVDAMAKRMAMPKEKLTSTLGLARATIDRKVRDNKPLSADEGARVLGMARLVGQVQTLVQDSGNAEDFDAAEWVARWLDRPLPALGGQRPADLMDTPDGQGLVSNLVARMQGGAYS